MDDEMTPPTEADVRHGIDRSRQLVAEAERLAHSLNVQLDEIQSMLTERKQEL